MLRQLGVWDELAGAAEPILDMVITDSRTRDVARPIFLTFDGRTDDGEPFAHMVENGALNAALTRAAPAAGAEIIAPDSVVGFDDGAVAASVRLASGRALASRLLVAADGVRSRLRDLAGIKTVTWSYRQSGIVVTVAHDKPHRGAPRNISSPAVPSLSRRSPATARRWCGRRPTTRRGVVAAIPASSRS
jgi:2-octaprenyl-6-methoxyphenol hydroxylase